MEGQVLDGRYRIVRSLGVGGFGQTFIAQDTRRPANPLCVVKQLKPASSDPQFLETARRLFQTEGEIQEQLGNHDQIPRLLAFFEENQEFYLVQEYVEGHPLTAELIPGQPWTEPHVIALLRDVLNTLTFVHSKGVIHRDIKPDNLIRRDGDSKVVLVDFGAVKQVRTQTMMQQNSIATVVIGTPGYMPSEQGQGKPKPSSDLYALGVVAIQAITGILPTQFQDDPNTGELIWRPYAQNISPGLGSVLDKLVKSHFRDRYATAAEALADLDRVASGYAPYPSAPQYPDPNYSANYTMPPSQPSMPPSQPSMPPRYPQTLMTEAMMPQNVSQPPRSAQGYIDTPRKEGKSPWFALSVFTILLGVMGGVGFALFSPFKGRIPGIGVSIDPASAECRFIVPTVGNSATVRAAAVRDASVLKTIDRNSKGKFLKAEGAFEQLQFEDGSTGWVFNDQVQPCNASAQAKSAPIAPPKPEAKKETNNNCNVVTSGDGSDLNVRTEPNAKAVITARLRPGTEVVRAGSARGNWIEINSPTTGWVSLNFITSDCSRAVRPAPAVVFVKPAPSEVPEPAPPENEKELPSITPTPTSSPTPTDPSKVNPILSPSPTSTPTPTSKVKSEPKTEPKGEPKSIDPT